MKEVELKLWRYERLPHLLQVVTQSDLDHFFRHAPADPVSISPDDLLDHLESVAASSSPPVGAEEPKARPKTFVPSEYQEKIFEWIKHGTGDVIVHAVAGSGKTKTLVEGSKIIDTNNGIFLAFNTSISEELNRRLPRMRARTIHSLGRELITRHLNVKARGNDDDYKDDLKYSKILNEFFKRQKVASKHVRLFWPGLSKLLNFTRLTLTDPRDEKALRELIAHHAIAIDAEYVEACVRAVAPILEEGVDRAAESIDFTDMVWLPNVFGLGGGAAYEWIFVDEAQDLNTAQRQLVLKLRADGGRILFVGDPRQAIYGFAGADSQSMSRIVAATGAVELPLSVCYRCPTSHVELAQRLVPHIEPAPDAARGILTRPSVRQAVGQMQPGDLVISRCSAPLAQVYNALRKAGIPAYIVGEDLKRPLQSIVGKIEMRPDFNFNRFPDLLDAYLAEQTAALRKDHPEPEVAEIDLKDRVSTIRTIYLSSRPKSIKTLLDTIETMYARRNPAEAVRCSTIHRAKGLESERVFLVAPHLLPHPKATKGWQLEQEYNLQYVAYTRSKYFLAICEGEL